MPQPETPNAPSTRLASSIFNHRIILFCGSGGVGKTTTAAAVALQAARCGRKVLVVTIDPARRLATALGGIELGNIETRVLLDALDGDWPGELYAMMMDTKTASDELVTRFAPNKTIADTILHNKIYRTASESLAGSQEYVALGKLHELLTSERYDVIVVDTAPTRYALDFFEAPTRLLDLLDSSIMEVILSPVRRIHSTGFEFVRSTSALIAELLEKILGISLISDVSAFIMSLEGMLGGFRERAQVMHKLLKNPEITSLGIILTASPSSIHEATLLQKELQRLDMPADFMIVNRVHPDFFHRADLAQGLSKFINDAYAQEMIRETLERQGCSVPAVLTSQIVNGLEYAHQLGITHRLQVNKFVTELHSDISVLQVPFLSSDISDLHGLNRLTEALFDFEEGEHDPFFRHRRQRDAESSPIADCKGNKDERLGPGV